MAIYMSPGVYVKETDLSQIVRMSGASTGCLVFASSRGPVTPQFIASDKQFIETYGKPDPKVSMAHYAAIDFLREGGSMWCLRVVKSATFSVLEYDTTAGTLTAVTAEADPTAHSFSGGTKGFIIYPIGPGTYASNYKVSITNASATDKSFTISVFDATNLNVPLETWTVSMQRQLDGYGRQMYLEDVINTFSSRIRVLDNASATTDVSINVATPVAFSGASDGTTPGDSELTGGWETFVDGDNYTVNILINGGYSSVNVHQKMESVASRRGDAFAILDLPSASQAVSAALIYRKTTLNMNSSYAALYGPDFMRYDEWNDMQLYVPPSGAAAAVFCRTDTLKDPWWAPAGLNRGLVKNALGLRYKYLQGERDQLYDSQINYIQNFPGEGIAVFGQRTQQAKASALQSINVRRLLLVIEKAMARALKYSLFEPNDPFTRTQIVLMLTEFLQDVKNRRGLYDFKVVSDDTNNTPIIIDRNELYVDVYLKPTRAAEFIQLQSVITRTGASFEELIKTGGNF